MSDEPTVYDLAQPMSVQKYVADLSGDHLDLPEGCTDPVVQIYSKFTGELTAPGRFGAMFVKDGKLTWQQWVQEPHGYPGAWVGPGDPPGRWEGYEMPPGFKAVVLW